MNIQQFDVTTTHLNGMSDENIYIHVPEYPNKSLEAIIRTEKSSSRIGNAAWVMLKELEESNKVCLLQKALYGLHEKGRRWHVRLSEELKKFGLIQLNEDPCVFYQQRENEIFIKTVYADDILTTLRN